MRAFFSAWQLWISVFLVCGGALALIAIFLPWHHFEPPEAGLPQDPRAFSPALWNPSTGRPDLIEIALYVVPAGVTLLCAVVQMTFARSRLVRWSMGVIALLASIAGLGISLMSVLFGDFLNDGGYRYVVDIGASLAPLGYGLAILGAITMLMTGRQRT